MPSHSGISGCITIYTVTYIIHSITHNALYTALCTILHSTVYHTCVYVSYEKTEDIRFKST